MIKEITINGKLFAKYELEQRQIGIVAYIKVIIPLFSENMPLSEDCVGKMIESVEGVKIAVMAYLNI